MNNNTHTSDTDKDDTAFDVLIDAAMDEVMESPEYELLLDREYDRRLELFEQAVEGADTADFIFNVVSDAISEAVACAVLETPEFDVLLDEAIEVQRRKAEGKRPTEKDSLSVGAV